MNTPKILAFAGSTRKDSVNKRLAKIAILAADKAGAETTFIDLHDYNMPLYSEDLLAEHGMPDGVIAFKEMLKNHNGFLISSPEYNGSLTGTLKNAIDWATIKADGEERMACWNGKIAGLLSASPGGLGGIRGLHHLRTILAGIGTFVLPNHLAVGNSTTNLQNDEQITDEKLQQQVENLSIEMVRVIRGLH
ncbi:MAG TPA: NADPH-dependent oxidoreductase [Phycisphaerales bacterium]|nr:NADPH-dependent oxidoreductase [Phycisphaerales bacterium]HIB01029.1 NADPH-dependent oxidoreductase [Phycisphaerales bacterium]HIB50735.1 NADPH-dependent oxidoreductase [Phycisphaerales bacterium]HIN83726.1 NADPH-dependent oxidoreductase [Phycisphaerales bacterium]HIO20271.1 NADPH-dependent oxidoreductase [Phycisphaerales bacterium]